MGRRAEVEPTYVHPQFALVHALHAALAIAGSIVAVSQPGIGFALVLFAATSAYLDLNTRFYLLRRLFFRRASQNVVSPGGRPEAPMRLVLVAHFDAGPHGLRLRPRGEGAGRRLSPRLRVLLSPWRIYFWGGLAALLPIIGVRMAGLDATWLSIVQMVPTVVLIVAIFLLVDIALSDTVPGRHRQRLGRRRRARGRRAPARRAARRTSTSGSSSPAPRSARPRGCAPSWPAHRGNLDPASTAVVNVDSVGYGTPAYTVSEGAVDQHPERPRAGVDLRGARRRAALPLAPHRRRARRPHPGHPGDHDHRPRRGRAPLPRPPHRQDVPANCDPAAIGRADRPARLDRAAARPRRRP